MESALEPIVVAGIAVAQDRDTWVSFNKNTLLMVDKKKLCLRLELRLQISISIMLSSYETAVCRCWRVTVHFVSVQTIIE